MTEETAFEFGSMGGAMSVEAALKRKVGTKRANELLERIAEATMPKMKKGIKRDE